MVLPLNTEECLFKIGQKFFDYTFCVDSESLGFLYHLNDIRHQIDDTADKFYLCYNDLEYGTQKGVFLLLRAEAQPRHFSHILF
jgi:hypothetical protein